MARSRDSECATVLFKKGACDIIIKQGDLFHETDVDAIVIPTPERGVQASHSYPLFESLCSTADQSTKKQIKSLSAKIEPSSQPQIISSAKPAIILTATPYYENEKKAAQLLHDTYLSCLQLATSNKCQTIAFPSIGCGQSGFPTRVAAKYLFTALDRFEPSSKTKLTEIRIIIYQKSIYDGFVPEFTNECLEKHSKIQYMEILTKTVTPSHMPSNRQSATREPQEYPDDFDDEGTVDRCPPSSRLDPEAPEFRSKTSIQDRPTRQYRLSNDRTKLIITQGDILKTKVDAIVNAANESMVGESGVDGLIHQAAGNELYRACKAHKEIYDDIRLPTGRSRILLSYNLKKTAHYIINTTGPRYDSAQAQDCKDKLTSCYATSLRLANLYDLETIAFTAISCGAFDYPPNEGADVALRTVDERADNLRKVWFVLKDDNIYDAWVKTAEELKLFSLDDSNPKVASASTASTSKKNATESEGSSKLEADVIKRMTEMRVIDASGADDTEKFGEPDSENPPEGSKSDSNEERDRGKDEGGGDKNPKRQSKTKDSEQKKGAAGGGQGAQITVPNKNRVENRQVRRLQTNPKNPSSSNRN